MAMLVLDPAEDRRLRRQRALTGADRFDEVWEGVYMMAPLANNEHQFVGTQLGLICHCVIRVPDDGLVYVGVNVSDRRKGWKKNYRCPDVAVYLMGNPAEDCGTHWFGGPDFGAEIVSPYDRTWEKLDFYAKVGVRELLIVDRKPWRLELYRLDQGQLKLVGKCTVKEPAVLASMVLPLTFTLRADKSRTRILVEETNGDREWLI